MHLSILSKNQEKQLHLLNHFKREYTLVGGTAIALQIGHRKSIDFDLFKPATINTEKIKKKLKEENLKFSLLYEDKEALTVIIDSVKWTYFQYPFEIYNDLTNEPNFKSPKLITLAAMKAYALGRRAKWKDYVDLFVLLKDYFSLVEVANRAGDIFGDGFSEKLFRQQLVYFQGIDYSEPIDWVTNSISEQEIKRGLEEVAII